MEQFGKLTFVPDDVRWIVAYLRLETPRLVRFYRKHRAGFSQKLHGRMRADRSPSVTEDGLDERHERAKSGDD